jgi:hypothetical protein
LTLQFLQGELLMLEFRLLFFGFVVATFLGQVSVQVRLQLFELSRDLADGGF